MSTATATKNIAFLGLGAMGTPMAHRLLATGHPLTVWNRTASRTEPLVAAGAKAAGTPAQAVADADIVITMLSDPAAVLDVFAAFAPGLRSGATVIDASTIGPRALAEAVALLPQGTRVVDAPVMGSADRAASGELTLLVGGDTTGVEEILDTFGAVTRAGGPGTGAALKLVMIGAVVAGVTAIGEAMVLADHFGLPEDLVKAAMAHSPLAGIAARAFAQGSDYALSLAAKDVALGLSEQPHLAVATAVHATISAHPEAADDDLGQIVTRLRSTDTD